jgi:signal transduction histidine kinase
LISKLLLPAALPLLARAVPALPALLALALLLAPRSSFAQTQRIDSLKTLLAAQKDSSARLRTLLALCNNKESLPGDSICTYATRALSIARGLNDKPHLLLAEYYILLSRSTKGELDTVLAEDKRILAGISYAQQRDLYVKYSLQQARTFIKSARYKEAQVTLYLLLTAAEKAGDAVARIYALTYIGWTHMEMEQLPTALEWFRKAEVLLPTVRPGLDYSPLYSNMAAVLTDMGQHDSAWHYVQLGIQSSEKQQDLSYLANALAIQADILIHLRRNARAEASLNRAIAIRRKIGDPFYVLSDMAALASLYSIDNKPQQGIQLCQEGIALARKYHYTPKELYLSQVLAENYMAAKDYKGYGATLKNIITLKDSLYNSNSHQTLAEMQARYESERKENTIIEQKYNLARKNYLIYGLTALFLATLVLGVAVFEVRRHRQAIRLKEAEIEKSKRNAEAIDRAKEDERKRILADLHDELGSGLSSIRIMSDLLAGQSRDAGHTQGLSQGSPQNPSQPPNSSQLPNPSQSPNPSQPAHTPNASQPPAVDPALVIQYAQKISDISRNTSQGMNTIIWALNNENDSITDLCEYIGQFGYTLFDNSGICFHLSIPSTLPDIQLSGAHRKNIFLCVKESLHNILKHSGARNAEVSVSVEERLLTITVTDDGKGLCPGEPTVAHVKNKFGNGLKNINRRMQEIGGGVSFISNNGLTVQLQVPLT